MKSIYTYDPCTTLLQFNDQNKIEQELNNLFMGSTLNKGHLRTKNKAFIVKTWQNLRDSNKFEFEMFWKFSDLLSWIINLITLNNKVESAKGTYLCYSGDFEVRLYACAKPSASPPRTKPRWLPRSCAVPPGDAPSRPIIKRYFLHSTTTKICLVIDKTAKWELFIRKNLFLECKSNVQLMNAIAYFIV